MKSDQLAVLINESVKQLYKVEVEAQVELAPEGRGDFASNVAFELSKNLGKNPADIAKEIAEAMSDNMIESVTAEGPYLNITLKDKVWIDEVGQLGKDYGRSDLGKGQKAQVEFISANPTGPLTIGNARGGFIGDVLSNVLESQGYSVTREYYFNDAGTQIMKLVDSARIAAGITKGVQEYKGAYLDELAKEFKAELGATDIEAAQALTTAIRERYIEPAIKNMNIEIGHWFNERTLIEDGEYARIENELLDKGLANKKDGAVWALSSQFGDERDRVLRKSNGDVSYLGTDLAYHDNIFEKRGFDLAIKVLGADHSGQVISLKLMLENGLKVHGKIDFLIYQFVRLMRDGQEVKMGKRLGTYVTTDELIEEVGADVARVFFLMRSADSHMDFDLTLAKEESQKNPYWYLMYAYVRAQAILSKAKGKNLKPGEQISELTDKEKAILKQISQYPDVLADISKDFGVHKLAFFGQEVAKLFHDYYESVKIIDLPEEEAIKRLYFIQQISSFFEAYFAVLGLEPLKKM